MKRQLLCFSLLIGFITLFAQNDCPPANDFEYYDDDSNNSSVTVPTMRLGNNHYSQNMSGLRTLMTDLKITNPDLHRYVLPDYQHISGQHDFANTAMILGGLGGGIMIIAGVGSSDEPYYPPPNSCGCPSEPQYNGTIEDVGLVVGGAVLFLTGTLIYAANRLSSHDLIQFREVINRNSQGPFMEFSLRPAINFGPLSSAGLALLLEF